MSKRKHAVAYIKPDEPKFLRELKAQAGYREGPTVDTKREELSDYEEEDREDRNEEEPTVVVLKEGDLTAEEAEAIKKQKEEEEANAKADLSQRVVFNKSKTSKKDAKAEEDPVKKKSKREKQKKVPLSFDEDGNDE